MKLLAIICFLGIFFGASEAAFCSSDDKPIVHLEFVYEEKGDELHYHILAGNFLNVVSLQGSFAWKVDSLEFKRISKYGLPGMNSTNFNTEVAEKGNIFISWFTTNVRTGVTMEACDTLISFVFEAPHGPADLNLVSQPLKVEFHNSSLLELELKYDIRTSCSYACRDSKGFVPFQYPDWLKRENDETEVELAAIFEPEQLGSGNAKAMAD